MNPAKKMPAITESELVSRLEALGMSEVAILRNHNRLWNCVGIGVSFCLEDGKMSGAGVYVPTGQDEGIGFKYLADWVTENEAAGK